jgi:hypothetical protein
LELRLNVGLLDKNRIDDRPYSSDRYFQDFLDSSAGMHLYFGIRRRTVRHCGPDLANIGTPYTEIDRRMCGQEKV